MSEGACVERSFTQMCDRPCQQYAQQDAKHLTYFVKGPQSTMRIVYPKHTVSKAPSANMPAALFLTHRLLVVLFRRLCLQAVEEKVEETLFQMMAGACDVLAESECALVGGHTCEGSELALGFCVNGEVDRRVALRKGGMVPGTRGPVVPRGGFSNSNRTALGIAGDTALLVSWQERTLVALITSVRLWRTPMFVPSMWPVITYLALSFLQHCRSFNVIVSSTVLFLPSSALTKAQFSVIRQGALVPIVPYAWVSGMA